MTKMLHVADFDRTDGVRTIEVAKENKDTYTTTSGEQFYKAWVFPLSAEQAVREVVAKRAELRKAYDDSAKLIFELRNRIARGEFK